MPTYETIFIAEPELPEADADALCKTFGAIVEEGKGNLLKTEHWGKRKLAYVVRKHQEGYFYHLRYDAPEAVVPELERRLRNSEQILKFLSVRLDRKALEVLAESERKAAEKAAAKALRDAEKAARQQREEEERAAAGESATVAAESSIEPAVSGAKPRTPSAEEE